MENTTQWSIIWSAALHPPLDMLPSSSVFCNISDNAATNSAYLFGFASCFPTLPEACEAPTSQVQDETDSEDIFCDGNTDFSTLLMLEDLVPFV